MEPERWRQIERLYRAALEHADGERAAFLGNACGGDDTLRRQVESLLAGETQAEDFLESPALEIVAKACGVLSAFGAGFVGLAWSFLKLD